MQPQCKEEVVLIESSTLLTTLENYLRKHRYAYICTYISSIVVEGLIL